MAKTQTEKNNNSRRMANCSPVSGKLFLLSIILILPYIVNYAPNKENSYNASFSTNKDLKRFLAEPAEDFGLDFNTGSQVSLNTGSQVSLNTGSQVSLNTGSQVSLNTDSQNNLDTGSQVSLNNGPEDELEPNLEDNSAFDADDDEEIGIEDIAEHFAEDDEEHDENIAEHAVEHNGEAGGEGDGEIDVSSDRDDDELSDPESCLASDSDDDEFSDPPSSLESESESEPEFDNDNLEPADESSMDLGAKPKFFRKSRQNNHASRRSRYNDFDSDPEFDDDEDNLELAHAAPKGHEARHRAFRKSKHNYHEEDQIEEDDIEAERAMAEESLDQLFSNIDPAEIQNAFLSSIPFMPAIGGFGSLPNVNALNNDENDPEKQAKIDAKVNTIDNMLGELIDDFNLSETIQENMGDIQDVAHQLQHDPRSVSATKLVNVIASLASSLAQSCMDENGEIDPSKAEANAYLMKEKLDKIVEEANKPISED
ncbi:Plasmodium exported protein, unknown function [Plasmodium vinckei lentum]|uniref:Uncharacterized protein n=1 Tax=Plasmodium vinckei lentum TaxID=138297 RepID=A0A6V7RUH0_PLAVN|nr:Plasmodium exported protein, unknown function [Plasmodium vinckei lentum]